MQFAPPTPQLDPPLGLEEYHKALPVLLYRKVVVSPLSHDQPDDLEDDGPVSPIQNGLEVARSAHDSVVDVPNTALAAPESGTVANLAVTPTAVPSVAQFDAAALFVKRLDTHL